MELQQHWRDVICGFSYVVGEEFMPGTYKIVCVDATFIGCNFTAECGMYTMKLFNVFVFSVA